MTASFRVVTGRRLVVVGAFAPVVPQVERGLDGLVAAGVLGLVRRRTPVGVHVVHRDSLLEETGWTAGWLAGETAVPGGDASRSPRVARCRSAIDLEKMRIARLRGARHGSAAHLL